MAALSSSLDPGVNSMAAYYKGHAFEVRVRQLRLGCLKMRLEY